MPAMTGDVTVPTSVVGVVVIADGLENIRVAVQRFYRILLMHGESKGGYEIGPPPTPSLPSPPENFQKTS
jgi:hypothetical protein